MKLLIIGKSCSYLSEAGKIAYKKGADVTHSETTEQALAHLRSGKGAELIMIDTKSDIKTLVTQLKAEHINIEVIACPIIREESGLARSSRNELLSPEDREFAAILSKTLFKIAKKSSDKRIKNLKKYGLKKLSKSERLELEYLEFVDPTTFERKKPKDKAKNTVVLLAARIGGVRLIDNILL